MNLIWKLLSKHISKGQLLGFFFANLVGLTIILLGFQFYIDVLPCFTGEDSFMNDDQVVLTKASARQVSFLARPIFFLQMTSKTCEASRL